jgi:hypothetical protein
MLQIEASTRNNFANSHRTNMSNNDDLSREEAIEALLRKSEEIINIIEQTHLIEDINRKLGGRSLLDDVLEVPDDVIVYQYYSYQIESELPHIMSSYETKHGTDAMNNATLLILLQENDQNSQVSVVSEKLKVYNYGVKEVEFLYVDGRVQKAVDKWLAHRKYGCSTCNIL